MNAKYSGRLLALLILTLAGCAHVATVSEKQPQFHPPPGATGDLEPVAQGITSALHEEMRDPLVALGELLTATEVAAQHLARNPSDTAAREAYNFAVARVLGITQKAKLAAWGGEPLRVPGTGGDWLLSGRTDIMSNSLIPLFDFIPVDQITIGGPYATQHQLKSGLGAPLVATSKAEIDATKIDPFAQGKRIFYGVTAVLRFEGRRCLVSFEDPLKTETVTFAGHTFPLAADFTASIALSLEQASQGKQAFADFLSPGKHGETARLARFQPYDPTKIPVIFVHGLTSSPSTWMPMINALRGDAVVRARYQLWFFSYPTGDPYPHSAALMRRHMDAINAQYPGHKKIVLIGHSMGGCISRLLLTDTGNKIWMNVFEKPPEQVPLSPETKKLYTEALIFKHRPEIARVIFISAPLRGSEIARNWLGRFGSSLVKAPVTLLKAGVEARQYQTTLAGELKLKRIPSSVDTLAPNDRFVMAINEVAVTPDIPYNVISGDRGKGGNKDKTKPIMSDGVVPYWSSHMEGAQSELVVPSNHGANANPQAIAEVKRILKLHLASGARATSENAPTIPVAYPLAGLAPMSRK